MNISLQNLIDPEVEPLGYPVGWVGRVERLLLEVEAPSGGMVLLDSSILGEVVACEGLWASRRPLVNIADPAWVLHRDFAKSAILEFVRLHLGGGEESPLDLVHRLLDPETSHDALTSAWLLLMSDDKRAALADEITSGISRLVESWPEVLDGSKVQMGPVAREVGFEELVLQSHFTDLVVGEHRVGDGVFWPGAVLVHIVAGPASNAFLDSLSVDVLVHTLATGCPPARIVVYSPTTGFGCALDVERDWLMEVVGSVRAAVKSMKNVIATDEVTVTPGHHCVMCPNKNECPVSEADEYPF